MLVAARYDAYSLTGGTATWVRSGRPLETGAATVPLRLPRCTLSVIESSLRLAFAERRLP